MSIKTDVPFNGTKEQEEQLIACIAKHKGEQGSMMPILQEAQAIYGYLPLQVQKIIARESGFPLSEIYGVVTFYSQFNLEPKGKYKISVCMGTACYVKGAGKILDLLKQKLNLEVGGMSDDGLFSLEATRCIGACGLAPVLTVNEDVYGKLVDSDVDKIVAKYKV